MNVQEIKDFLIQLLNRELESEYDYRITSDKDTTYIKQCIKVKQWLLGKGKTGIDNFINNTIIKENIEKYIKGIE